MKRMLIALTVCSLASAGAFAVLVLQDRRLGVPLPYGLALACASMLVLAPALLICFETLRARRPIRIEAAPPRAVQVREEPPPRVGPSRHSPVQGVVLLDFSSARARREEAA